jgi:hypothetical protein
MNKINLNQKVKVKVTETGRKYLKNHQYYKNYPVHKDKEGYYLFQFWELMGIFGEAMQLPTITPVIEPDIFLVDD